MKINDYTIWVGKEMYETFNKIMRQEFNRIMNRKTTINPKTVFDKVKDYTYKIPCYTVTIGKGIELCEDVNATLPDGIELLPDHYYIQMVRGSKVLEENTVNAMDGVLIEQLVAVALDHLQTINTGELATRENAIAITKLEEALLWLAKRTMDREANGTLGTYNK